MAVLAHVVRTAPYPCMSILMLLHMEGCQPHVYVEGCGKSKNKVSQQITMYAAINAMTRDVLARTDLLGLLGACPAGLAVP